MDIFDKMAEVWPSAVVARVEIKSFTGGGLSTQTMANFDSQGIGPKKKIIIGNKICYPKDVFIQWLREKSLGKNIQKDDLHLIKG